VYIFYYIGGKFGEVAGTRRSAWRYQTLALASSVLSVLGSIRVEHRTHCTRRRVFRVGDSGVAWLLQVLLTESTGCSRHVQWCEFGVR